MRTNDMRETTIKLLKEVKMIRTRSRSDVRSIIESSDSDSSTDTDVTNPSRRNRAWDPYCWICHGGNVKRRCSTCLRSYHIQCIITKGAKQPKSEYRCELCLRMDAAMDDYAKRKVSIERIHTLLGHITARLLENDDFNVLGSEFSKLRKPATFGPDIINPFDLSIVTEKVEEHRYRTTLEFISDIRWIRHNAEIVLREKDTRLSIARNMEELCEKEVYDIEMCGECFGRANITTEWFTGVCNPPHLLVWARMKGHPFWPAKVIGFSDSNHKKIDVRFFGKHDMGNVETSDCILFSDNPNKKFSEREQNKIDSAIKEAKKYMKNIGKTYLCKLERPKSKSSFDASQIGSHLTEMIPALNLPKNFKLKQKPDFLRKLRRRKQTSLVYSAANNSYQNILKSISDCSVLVQKCDNLLNESQIEFIRYSNPNYSVSNGKNESWPHEMEQDENGPSSQLPSNEHEGALQYDVKQPIKQQSEPIKSQYREQNDEFDLVNKLSMECNTEIDNKDDHKNNNTGRKRNAVPVDCCEIPNTSSDGRSDVAQEKPQVKRPRITQNEVNADSSQQNLSTISIESHNKVSNEEDTNKLRDSMPLLNPFQKFISRKAYSSPHMACANRKKVADDKKINSCNRTVDDETKTKSNSDGAQSNMNSMVENDFGGEIGDTEPIELDLDAEVESISETINSPQPDSPLPVRTLSESQLESPPQIKVESQLEEMPESQVQEPEVQVNPQNSSDTQHVKEIAVTESQSKQEPSLDDKSSLTGKNDAQITSETWNVISNNEIEQTKENYRSEAMPEPNIEQQENSESSSNNQNEVERSEMLEDINTENKQSNENILSDAIPEPSTEQQKNSESFSNNQNEVERSDKDNEHIQQSDIRTKIDSSTQKASETESNQNSVNASAMTAEPSLPTNEHPLQKALQYHQQNTTILQAEIFSLKDELNVKHERIHQLEKELEQKDKMIRKMKSRYNALKADHKVQLRAAIEETKNKEWCLICRKESKTDIFRMTACSAKCLLDLWSQRTKQSTKLTAATGGKGT